MSHIHIDAEAALEATPVYERLCDCTTHAEVLDVMTGVPWRVFIFLDEKPGWFGGDRAWHARLRQVRNDPTLNLFERLAP